MNILMIARARSQSFPPPHHVAIAFQIFVGLLIQVAKAGISK